MRPISASETSSMTSSSNAMLTPPAIPHQVMRSPWHSPVPYLFGGLAAMLGLIAFALLILACSYWRLSNRQRRGDGDIESGNEKEAKTDQVFEEKFLVIMAGDNKPTFLATPASNRPTYCGCGDNKGFDKDDGMKMENDEKVKRESHDHGDQSAVAAVEGEAEERETATEGQN
ncbi:Protein GLUTAMINE DUMPER 1 [Linum grandiflorum]